MDNQKEKLNSYFNEVSNIVLAKQNPASGLIPASVAVTTHGDYRDAWVRDNVYSIMCVWGLSLAYKRIDDDLGRAYELEHATIKNMRGLLVSMMRQANKVEEFKNNQGLEHSLHAKYNTNTGFTVVGDFEWGHLQIDATSIFILMLAQMTASGLQIVYTMDEVCFVQNLVFYIERAYRTPDFGIWERGNKINHGDAELNSSSIGMCVAALQAINGLNLFGSRGSPASTIHVLPDEITRNVTTLHSALPRESYSKEIDAALLSVISYPAFAVQDPKLVERTKNDIIKKLGGRYGCKRFLRDGHQTLLENTSRLHYEPNELRIFGGIECEWPLFFTYLVLDGFFSGNYSQVREYREKLERVLVAENLHKTDFSVYKLVPELYVVPLDLIEAEKKKPGSQERFANENTPLVWAQSLFILGNLISDDLLSPADLDPLGRRFIAQAKQKPDVVVQVVLLAETKELQAKMAMYGLDTQTVESCAPITISHPSALRDAYSFLGENAKLGLTGRPKRPMGTLSTCKLYRCQGKLYSFLPHFMDREEFYLVSDNDYLVSVFEQELAFIKNNWTGTGRPTMVVMLTKAMLGGIGRSRAEHYSRKSGFRYTSSTTSKRNLLNLMMSLRSGVCGGVRVRVGRLGEMVNTACIESLDFLVEKNENIRDIWHSILCGTVGELTDRLVTKSEQTPIKRRTTGVRRRTVSHTSHTSDLDTKSPLLSPFYTEDPMMYDEFKLNNEDDDYKLNSEAVSPSRLGNRSNRFAKGALSHDYTEKYPQESPVVESEKTSFSFVQNENTEDTPEEPSLLLTLTLQDPSHLTEAINFLRDSSNLFDQIDILHYIYSCKGLDYMVDDLGTIKALLEEIYQKATAMKQWTIVRQAAGLLRKVVNSLTINVTDLLIRQKPVTVGFGSMEYFMTSPLSPAALQDIIYRHCASDVREAPLVQEVITYLGSFIRSNSSLFDGIMRVRTHFFIITMREEISRMKGCDEEEAIEHLMQLSPFELKSLLGQVLSCHEEACSISTPTVSSRWRQIQMNTGLTTLTEASGIPYPNSLVITTQSAGFSAGNFARIEIKRDGQGVPITFVFGRGLNVCIIDPLDASIVETCSFDTHASIEESEDFAKTIEWLEPGMLVIVCVKDDCFENLTDSAKSACEILGSKMIKSVSYRDSWCLIGEKSGDAKTVREFYRSSKEGPTDVITLELDLLKKRKKLISSETNNKDINADIRLAGVDGPRNMFLPSNGRWLRRRKNDGALNRVPPDFYPKVWTVLSKCQGILINRDYLPRDPTISEKTPEEFNFALQVESLLDVIKDPAERQIAVDCLVVIAHLAERNPEIQINEKPIELLRIVRDAIFKYWQFWINEGQAVSGLTLVSDQQNPTAVKEFTSAPVVNTPIPTPTSPEYHESLSNSLGLLDSSFEKNERFARRLFFDLMQDGPEGTNSYLARSCVKLAFTVKWQ